jgi:2-oxoacid:acceptor oxidoreductase delta subunit (pyruvate/2-ketoisovalerate family)
LAHQKAQGFFIMSNNNRRNEEKFVLKSWRDFPPMNVSKGSMQHNLTGSWRFIRPVYEDKIPACQNACPSGNDIEGWIRLLKGGDPKSAYLHLKKEQPFPAILGRVCFKYCEKVCNRSLYDHSVKVRELERFIGDSYSPVDLVVPERVSKNGKRLAIVGSGPAGMAAAYFSRLLGFAVTIFEAHHLLGGILRLGIPAYRLPHKTVDAEFDGLQTMGVELKPNITIGQNYPFAKLTNTYDYVFLATGRHDSIQLRIEGENQFRRVMSAFDMLRRIAKGDAVDLGSKVIVIGGGNTAIDAGRTARRLGAEVTIIYRRSITEMPAHPEEIEDATKEGVQFKYLSAPDRIEVDIKSRQLILVCSEMVLGEPDATGRCRPKRIPEKQFSLKADSILTAIGEAPDLSYLQNMVPVEMGMVPTDAGLRVETLVSSGAKIYAGGDITASPFSVVHAVASGKRAAIAMDCDRKGLNSLAELENIAIGTGSAVSFSRYTQHNSPGSPRRNEKKVVDHSQIVFDYFEKRPPIHSEPIPPNERILSFSPTHLGFDSTQAQQESERCMHCGRCTECDNCLIFCPDMSVSKTKTNESGYAVDYDYCKGCGICFSECPRHAITMVEETPHVSSEED